jgi:hypothetical protein
VEGAFGLGESLRLESLTLATVAHSYMLFPSSDEMSDETSKAR